MKKNKKLTPEEIKNLTPEELNKQMTIGIDLATEGKDKTAQVKIKDGVIESVIGVDKINY